MKIGLALSGGGALGTAHIGVIEELEKNGIKIDFVCGVSAGAIIGLAYACGGLESLHAFFNQVSKSNFIKKNQYLFAGSDGAFKYVQDTLRELVGKKSFADFKTSFMCCATNLADGKSVVFESGDPVEAVMASSAYPGVFGSRGN